MISIESRISHEQAGMLLYKLANHIKEEDITLKD
jgi:hypothetical protein